MSAKPEQILVATEASSFADGQPRLLFSPPSAEIDFKAGEVRFLTAKDPASEHVFPWPKPKSPTLVGLPSRWLAAGGAVEVEGEVLFGIRRDEVVQAAALLITTGLACERLPGSEACQDPLGEAVATVPALLSCLGRPSAQARRNILKAGEPPLVTPRPAARCFFPPRLRDWHASHRRTTAAADA
jgi:hypothetical protein